MKVETKFSNGDKLYNIYHGRECKWVNCKLCDGEKILTLTNGKTIKCCECYGRGGEKKYMSTKWLVGGWKTVGQVRVKIIDSFGVSEDCIGDNYKPQLGREEEYMMNETGVGTGSIYKVKNLFTTITLAQTECERRNGDPGSRSHDEKN